MTLYAGVPLKPGDLMELEFLMPGGARIAAVVRSRTGFCFGLEFLTPLSVDAKPATTPSRAPAQIPDPPASSNRDLKTVLRNKELEIERLKKEIATLRTFGKF